MCAGRNIAPLKINMIWSENTTAQVLVDFVFFFAT